ncbi:uncharacterized protein [Miscanthus floridulus]|uniref:uncharacterized protein n=1 Tax=Miscanthus floridulus TaxID=154761 RepID=UPI0034595092
MDFVLGDLALCTSCLQLQMPGYLMLPRFHKDAVAPPCWLVAVGGGGRAGLCREAAAATQARAQEEVPHLHFVSGDPDPLTAHPCASSLEAQLSEIQKFNIQVDKLT